MENWLLNNGYVLVDGIYMNYNKAIIVILVENNYPTVGSLYGFHTKQYIELYKAIAEYYYPFN